MFFSDMPRNYKKKTTRGEIPIDIFERAYEEIRNDRMSIREAAKTFEIDKMTLYRYKNKKEKASELPEATNKDVKMGYAKHRQILSDELEQELNKYILASSKIYYGLTPKNVRELAYELAIANQIQVPDTWINAKMASAEWFYKFLKRQPNLSLREPEATSLSRATSFNRHNVATFFENLKTVLEKYNFERKDIWNSDETGVQTVQRPSKIVAEKGVRQVAKATSAERGQTVTITTAVSAIGHALPPLFIFPRVFYKDHFVKGGPPGCIGVAHPSGWMTGTSFLVFVKHFHSHVKSTPELPCLLLLDNHDSHLSIDVLKFCKSNGIVLLSFPPHTSHRLQPLDVSVYGPFKKHYFTAADNWLISNPGKTITIYDIPTLVNTAFINAMTPTNIVSGFKATGVMPFNENIFQDEDFLSSFVTDRQPLASSETIQPESGGLQQPSTSAIVHLPSTSRSEINTEPSTSAGVNSSGYETPRRGSSGNQLVSPLITPEEIRPLPKAGERKKSGKGGRKPLKSSILTDTPIKNRLEQEAMERERKKNIKTEKTKLKLLKSFDCRPNIKGKNEKRKRAQPYKHVKDDTDSEEDEYFCLVCFQTYSSSKPGQDWIQCVSCKKWAHISCAEDNPFYTCKNCQSDPCFSSESE